VSRSIKDLEASDERVHDTYLPCYQSDTEKFAKVREARNSSATKPRYALESTRYVNYVPIAKIKDLEGTQDDPEFPTQRASPSEPGPSHVIVDRTSSHLAECRGTA